MSETQKGNGVVVDRPDLSVIDTREMEWAQDVQLEGGYEKVHGGRKVLARDEEGQPSVMVNLMPPGFTVPDLPYRHYHSTVREFAFFLTGMSQVWEYESAEQQNGQFISKKQGFFMDRLPGSLQGLEPGPTTPTGAQILCWRTGSGTEMGDPDFDTETVHVDYAADWQPKLDVEDVSALRAGEPLIISRPDLTVLDTRAMQWEPVTEWATIPGLQGAKRKVLARHDDGALFVMLSYLPAGCTLPDLPYRHYHTTVHEFAYFLEGELPLWDYADADQQQGELVTYKAGYFMHRRPGSIHGFEPGPTSAVGAVMLTWRSGSGTLMGEKNFATETVEVPFA